VRTYRVGAGKGASSCCAAAGTSTTKHNARIARFANVDRRPILGTIFFPPSGILGILLRNVVVLFFQRLLFVVVALHVSQEFGVAKPHVCWFVAHCFCPFVLAFLEIMNE